MVLAYLHISGIADAMDHGTILLSCIPGQLEFIETIFTSPCNINVCDNALNSFRISMPKTVRR